LADNIYEVDPHGADYTLRSEAEHNLLNLLDGTHHIVEALDIVENVMHAGYEFVQNPNTSQENKWNFTIGSAPRSFEIFLADVKPGVDYIGWGFV